MSTNPMRKRTLLRTILETLGFADTYAIPADALRSQVDGLMRPPTTDEEWQQCIAQLSSGDNPAIVPVADVLDDELVQWARTARGKVIFETL